MEKQGGVHVVGMQSDVAKALRAVPSPRPGVIRDAGHALFPERVGWDIRVSWKNGSVSEFQTLLGLPYSVFVGISDS